MKYCKKAFTILELLIVIAILAILAIIVVPKFIGKIDQAMERADLAEIDSVTKAAHMFYADYGYYPTLQGEQPTFGDPKNLKFTSDEDGEGLYPKYLDKLPHFSYWFIDYKGKVYHIDKLPCVINGDTITLSENYNYIVYNEDGSIASENVTGSIKLEDGQYVKVIDNKGRELPVFGNNFKGAMEHPEAAHEYSNENGNIPSKIKWIVAEGYENICDGDLSTSVSTSTGFTKTTPTNIAKDGPIYISWEGDLTGRVISIVCQGAGTDGSDGGNISIIDKDGKKLQFIDADTDIVYTDMKIRRDWGKVTKNIVIPPNADRIYIHLGTWDSIYIYEIWVQEDGIPPKQVSNLRATPVQGKAGILLNYKNPSDTDFNRVAIYRNGTFIAYSTGETYEDKALWSDTDYSYTLYVIDNAGNRSKPVSTSTRTYKPLYKFYSDYPEIIDGYNDTSRAAQRSSNWAITWDGDLAGKVVSVLCKVDGTSEFSDISIYVADDANKTIPFIEANTSVIYTTMKIEKRHGLVTKHILIPSGAKKIVFSNTSLANIIIYDIWVEPDVTPPQPIKNLKAIPESDRAAITLSWENPTDSDFNRVAIYRDRNYVASTTNSTYTNTALAWDTEYTYTLYAVDNTGNYSEPVTVTARTNKLLYSLYTDYPVFIDGDRETSLKVTIWTNNPRITFGEDLSGKTVRLIVNKTKWQAGYVSVYDDSNKRIARYSIYNTAATGEYVFVIPEGARSILFEPGDGGLIIYEVIIE